MGELVLPAGTKMRLLGEALGRLSPLDFRVLFVLFEKADRATGTVEISHDELATEVGCKRRAAENSTARLIQAGDLRVERKQIGQRANGTPVFGGRGRRNRYRLVFERPSAGTVFQAERPSAETVTEDRSAGSERPSSEAQKTVPANLHTLCPLNLSHKFPGAHARARDPNFVAWLAVRKRLSDELGSDVFDAWFSKVTMASVTDGVATLRTPTRFIANYLTNNFAPRTLAAWQSQDQNITRVRFDPDAPSRKLGDEHSQQNESEARAGAIPNAGQTR